LGKIIAEKAFLPTIDPKPEFTGFIAIDDLML